MVVPEYLGKPYADLHVGRIRLALPRFFVGIGHINITS